MRVLYRALLLPRLIEEKALLLLRQGRLSKWFSGMGQEAIAVGVTFALEADDWILPMHRNLGVFTTRSVDLGRLFRQLFGKDGGFTKGRDRTFHFGLLEKRIVGMISHLGATVPVADGLALAAQLRGERRVAATFSGDGGTSEGDFHEAVNLAAVWKLPVLFVIENNQYGLSTPVSEQYACADLADRGIGYGIPGVVVDGNDVLAVVEAVGRAAVRARSGDGPTLLEFKTFRMRGHEEASGTAYVPKHLFEEWGRKDPVARFEQWLFTRGLLDEPTRDKLRTDLRPVIDALVDEALAAPDPVSSAESGWPTCTRPARSWSKILSRRRRRPRSATSTPSRTACAKRCAAGARPSSWARTSRSTAASSRSPKASWKSSARRAYATRRSSSRARSGPPSASPSTASGR